MKYLFTILFLAGFNLSVQAQKPDKCNCRTKEGVNSVTVEGTIKYKGVTKSSEHRYDLDIVFENQTKCILKVESVLIGTDLFPLNDIVLDSKNKKKAFKKSLPISKTLETELGLDDDYFINLLVSYKINNFKCSNEYTVLHKNSNQK